MAATLWKGDTMTDIEKYLAQFTVGVIGVGSMGGAIARGLVQSGALPGERVLACDHNAYKLEALASDCGIQTFADADALFLRGRAYFLQKNYEQAKVDFDAAVETKESYQLCLDIYELYQESSMKADGDRYLEAAVKIEPKTTEDYYNIGCAYYYLEEQDEAVKAFSKAMKDGSSAAMEMLGEVYLSNGQNDEAKALFSSYLSTDGFAAAANNGLALCALAENDTDSALSYIEEGLKTAEDSDRENLLFNQIVSYEKRADFDTAKSLMADFLAAYPENTAAQRENTFLQNR